MLDTAWPDSKEAGRVFESDMIRELLAEKPRKSEWNNEGRLQGIER